MADLDAQSDSERSCLEHRVEAVKRERYKWADMAMQGAVPGDMAGKKQRELSQQMISLERALDKLVSSSAEHKLLIERLLTLMPICTDAYLASDDTVRRQFNQAWFEALLVDDLEDRTSCAGHPDEAG